MRKAYPSAVSEQIQHVSKDYLISYNKQIQHLSDIVERKSHETFRLNKELAAVKAHCVKIQNELAGLYRSRSMELPPYLVPNLDFGKNYDPSQYPNQKSLILLNARVEQLAAENQIMAHRLRDGG